MLFVFFALTAIVAESKDQISKKIEEIINLEDNIVYNVKTDGRGGIEIKEKGPDDSNWTTSKKFDVHENAGELLDHGAKIVKTDDNNYILAYAPKPEEFNYKPEQLSYKENEYKKLAKDPSTEEALYKNEPKFVEGVQTSKGSSFFDYKPTAEQKKAASKPPDKKKKKKDGKKKKAAASDNESESSEISKASTIVYFLSTCSLLATLMVL